MKAIQTMAGIAFAAVFSTLFLSVALAAPEGLQKRTIQKTLPPEIAQQLRGKPAATFQLADQPVGAGTVILGDDFEGAFPGSWDVFDNDGAVNGEVFWAKRRFEPIAEARAFMVPGAEQTPSVMVGLMRTTWIPGWFTDRLI